MTTITRVIDTHTLKTEAHNEAIEQAAHVVRKLMVENTHWQTEAHNMLRTALQMINDLRE